MKKIIAKTLSILLVIAMLVPMMGIMTSAEEELVNIFQVPSDSSSSLTINQYYDYEDYNIKPGDVITIAPISKNNTTSIIYTQYKNGGKYYTHTSYSLKDIYVEDITNGTAIAQFTIPENTARFRFVLLKLLSNCTLMTVNQPFGAQEYLDYMNQQNVDLSSFIPNKYTGEFENAFSISDANIDVELYENKNAETCIERTKNGYAASGYIPVSEGDLVYYASSGNVATFYCFDSDKNYVTSVITSNQVGIFYDGSLSCRVSVFEVPKDVAYIRLSVNYKNSLGYVVTINQPITLFNEYKSLTTPVITIEGSYTYTGEKIEPPVEVKFGGKVLKKDVDYNISYSNNLDSGVAKATVKFIGKYSALKSISQSFVIAPKSVEDASVTFNLSSNKYTYTGEEIKPAFTLIVDQYMLSLNRDFTLEYTNNTNAGTATVTATFIRNYSGTISKTFTILPEKITLDSSNLVLSTTEYTYTGSPIIPEVSFSIPGKNLEEGKDYTITCENNVNAGTATVTATLIGNYSGSISKEFTIAPREVVLVWENTDMMYNGERQTPTAKLFGVVAGDVCDVTVSGWGKFGGTYTAKVESISNENYVLSGDTTCQFTIIANPIEVAIDVACDIYDIIPDSAKQAVADAAVEAAKNAASDLANAAYEVASDLADTAIEAAETKAAEIKDTVESAYDQARDFFTGLFGSFSFFG